MDSRIRAVLAPHIAFVALISLLAHKEWRFIVYVVPVFNISAARAGRWMYVCSFRLFFFVDDMHRLSRRKSTNLGRLLFLAFWSLIVINIGATTVFAITSMANYPGGAALTQFTQSYSPEKGVYPFV